MKSLYYRFFILALAWMVLGSASPAKKMVAIKYHNTNYYFYWSDTDTFHEYNSIPGEESDATGLLGYTVDQNFSGATLVLKGYANNAHPHNLWPVIFLYEHN